MTEPRDAVRERQLISKHRPILEAWWRAHGREAHAWVALDAGTGRITGWPQEMPPTPSAVVRMERISRQSCRLRRVEAIEPVDRGVPILSLDAPLSSVGPAEETEMREAPAPQAQLGLVPPRKITRTNITLPQQIAVRDALQALLSPSGDGTWTYADGHSDESVASSLGFPCTDHNVAGVRRQLFGALRAAQPVTPADAVARIARLERRSDALYLAVVRLCTALGADPSEIVPPSEWSE